MTPTQQNLLFPPLPSSPTCSWPQAFIFLFPCLMWLLVIPFPSPRLLFAFWGLLCDFQLNRKFYPHTSVLILLFDQATISSPNKNNITNCQMSSGNGAWKESSSPDKAWNNRKLTVQQLLTELQEGSGFAQLAAETQTNKACSSIQRAFIHFYSSGKVSVKR